MNLIRYEPPTSRSMRRLFDDFFERSFAPFFDSSEEGMLPVDISETDSEMVVRASLPGFEPDDVDVQVHQGVLSIKAEHHWDEAREDERYHRRERRWGSMTRRVALPGMVQDAEDIRGEMKNGILTLHIPIPEQSKPRRVQIQGDSHAQAIESGNGHERERGDGGTSGQATGQGNMQASRDMESMASGESSGQQGSDR